MPRVTCKLDWHSGNYTYAFRGHKYRTNGTIKDQETGRLHGVFIESDAGLLFVTEEDFRKYFLTKAEVDAGVTLDKVGKLGLYYARQEDIDEMEYEDRLLMYRIVRGMAAKVAEDAKKWSTVEEVNARIANGEAIEGDKPSPPLYWLETAAERSVQLSAIAMMYNPNRDTEEI